MKKILLLLFSVVLAFSYYQKTPSDVYSYAMIIKKLVQKLREQEHIYSAFPTVPKQSNKYPRHVIQKAIEILNKINRYRLMKNYGEIYIPPYPIKDITPTDVYEMVKRVEAEIVPFIKDRAFLKSLRYKQYRGKTPNDVYGLLWSISLAFDELLGIHGYTPTDVYELSLKLLHNVQFLRYSQNIFTSVNRPKYEPNLHPNHALAASYEFLGKVKLAQEHLWIKPTDVPKVPQKVITPTEVFDAIQYDLAELQRIKYRLGLERYFQMQKVDQAKTPSDVVQNLRYAALLMPLFSFEKELVQYPQSSLQKTPNHVYAVTEEILRKIAVIKNLRGVKERPKNPPYIDGLKPIHVFQKAIEATEKAIRLKRQMGYYPSQVPSSPLRPITPNEVYWVVLRLDGIVTIILKKLGEKDATEFIYKSDVQIPQNKQPSDVYHNLWKIANCFDLLSASAYTPNETYWLSQRIRKKIDAIMKRLHIKQEALCKVAEPNIASKTPKDVFDLALGLFEEVKKVQKRLNMPKNRIIIPKEKEIEPNTVYNALRIINASINEILIHLKIKESDIAFVEQEYKDKTPTDVYKSVLAMKQMVHLLFDEENYEK